MEMNTHFQKTSTLVTNNWYTSTYHQTEAFYEVVLGSSNTNIINVRINVFNPTLTQLNHESQRKNKWVLNQTPAPRSTLIQGDDLEKSK